MALSSTEAELTGICRGTSQGLGLLAIAKDLGLHWELDVQTDATAAIGICKRKSLGKLRHLATSDLWIQDKLRAKEFTLTKIDGAQNPADCLTKHLYKATLERHMLSLSLTVGWGRAASAPTI